jgi:hypothetical protein
VKKQREKVLDEVPGVRPLYRYQCVLNGFAAKVTDRQANILTRTEGVVSLARNELRQLAATADSDTAATTAAGQHYGVPLARFPSPTPPSSSG